MDSWCHIYLPNVTSGPFKHIIRADLCCWRTGNINTPIKIFISQAVPENWSPVLSLSVSHWCPLRYIAEKPLQSRRRKTPFFCCLSANCGLLQLFFFFFAAVVVVFCFFSIPQHWKFISHRSVRLNGTACKSHFILGCISFTEFLPNALAFSRALSSSFPLFLSFQQLTRLILLTAFWSLLPLPALRLQ